MQPVTRRSAMLLTTVAMAGCASQSGNNAMTLSSVLDDVQLALSAISVMMPELTKQLPTLMTEAQLQMIDSSVASAQQLINRIVVNLQSPDVSGIVQQVEVDLNTALSVLDNIPLIPPPYSTIIAAAALVAPELEQLLNKQFGFQINRAQARMQRRRVPGMELAGARMMLKSVVRHGGVR